MRESSIEAQRCSFGQSAEQVEGVILIRCTMLLPR